MPVLYVQWLPYHTAVNENVTLSASLFATVRGRNGDLIDSMGIRDQTGIIHESKQATFNTLVHSYK